MLQDSQILVQRLKKKSYQNCNNTFCKQNELLIKTKHPLIFLINVLFFFKIIGLPAVIVAITLGGSQLEGYGDET